MQGIYMCPTPEMHCSGGKPQLNAATRNAPKKFHQTSEDSYRCYRKYLITVLGFEDMGNREFRDPNGGPRIFLSKKSKFAERFRPGKEGRFMPDWNGGGAIIRT